MANDKMKIHKRNISDQIFDILRDKISDGEYQEGEKLPGENELAEKFGVSRMTARASLQKLASLGIVEIRNGEGTFVKKFEFDDYIKEAANLLQNEKTTKNIAEFRKFFEPICVQLACEKRTEDQIKKLKEIYDEMLVASESSNINNFLEADYKFHLYICEITDNSIIKMIYQLLSNLTKQNYEETLRKYAKLNEYSTAHTDSNYAVKESAMLHKEILDDIINGNNEISKSRWSELNESYDATPLPDKEWK